MEHTEDVKNHAGSPSGLNVELDLLIKKFDSAVKIDISFGDDLTIDVLNKKRDELNNAVKSIKLANKILSEIHDAYTTMLERYSV